MKFVHRFLGNYSLKCVCIAKKPHLKIDRQGRRKNVGKTELSVLDFFCVIGQKINLDKGIGSIKKKKSCH